MNYDCVTLKAYAKINLSLDIIGRRDDGYHELESVMQSVSLCDDVTLTLTSQPTITISCSDKNIPCDERNTAYKAAKLMLNLAAVKCGCEIVINKRIPSQAGLGGGSADAATVIKALNKALELNFDEHELAKIGSQVGADVPFCIYNGTCLCKGIGEDVEVLPNSKKYHVVIVKPNFGISTPEAYKNFDKKSIESARASDKLAEAIKNGEDICNLIANDLEIAAENEEIEAIKAKLIENGALCAQMSGSGSAVFGLFIAKENALTANNQLSREYESVFVCETI